MLRVPVQGWWSGRGVGVGGGCRMGGRQGPSVPKEARGL